MLIDVDQWKYETMMEKLFAFIYFFYLSCRHVCMLFTLFVCSLNGWSKQIVCFLCGNVPCHLQCQLSSVPLCITFMSYVTLNALKFTALMFFVNVEFEVPGGHTKTPKLWRNSNSVLNNPEYVFYFRFLQLAIFHFGDSFRHSWIFSLNQLPDLACHLHCWLKLTTSD